MTSSYRPIAPELQCERPNWPEPQEAPSSGGRPVASSSAARAHADDAGGGSGASVGAVSRMKRSSAATTAAAASGEAAGATIRSCGRRFTRGTLARVVTRRPYRIMPAPTVSFVVSSTRMNEPVERLRR